VNNVAAAAFASISGLGDGVKECRMVKHNAKEKEK